METVPMHISIFWFFENPYFWKPNISPWHCFPVDYLFKISLWHCFPVYYLFKISLWHCFPVYYLLKISLWHGFRVPPTTPWSMCLPAALRWPQKKHVPGIWEHVSCGFSSIFIDLSLPPPRGLCACLRRFGDLRKNTPLEFWSMYLLDLLVFHRF